MPQKGSSEILVLALLSGFCGLSYELLYQRTLSNLLGDSHIVSATLFVSFLLGVGLGARFAHRFKGFLYAAEGLCGLYSLLFPFLLSALSRWEGLFYFGSGELPRILLALSLLLVPGISIGFALPLFSHYLQMSGQEEAFTKAYQVYHLGAIMGLLTLEFATVRYLGLSRSFWLLAGINILLAIRLRSLSDKLERAPENAPQESVLIPGNRKVQLFLLSFTSAVFQMILLGYSFHLFHPHRENFSLILLLVFVGLSGGAFTQRAVPRSFETWALGALTTMPISLGLQYWWNQLYYGFPRMLMTKALVMSLLALPTLVCLGALIPALVASKEGLAKQSGLYLWYSSLGNIGGYLGYVLILHQSFEKSHIVGGLVVLSLFALGLGLENGLNKAWLAIPILGVLILQKGWDENRFHLPQAKGVDEIRVFKSGPDTALLFRSKDDSYIAHNGHYSIRVSQGQRINLGEALSGLAPTLYAPSLSQALVLGHGSGITAGSTALCFDQTDVVEINPAFLAMSQELAYANFSLAKNKKAKIFRGDGRAFLAGQKKKYDLILNSITRPTYFAAGKVYTQDFYRQVLRHLKPGGLYVTWISHEMSGEETMTILQTLQSVFPHAKLYLVDAGYYLLLCSNEKLSFHQERLPELPVPLRKLVAERFKELNVDEVLQDLEISEELFPMALSAPINTDDWPILEFKAVRNFERAFRGFNPILQYSEQMGLKPEGESSLSNERRARRIWLYQRMSGDFFQGRFEDLFQERPAVKKELDAIKAANR